MAPQHCRRCCTPTRRAPPADASSARAASERLVAPIPSRRRRPRAAAAAPRSTATPPPARRPPHHEPWPLLLLARRRQGTPALRGELWRGCRCVDALGAPAPRRNACAAGRRVRRREARRLQVRQVVCARRHALARGGGHQRHHLPGHRRPLGRGGGNDGFHGRLRRAHSARGPPRGAGVTPQERAAEGGRRDAAPAAARPRPALPGRLVGGRLRLHLRQDGAPARRRLRVRDTRHLPVVPAAALLLGLARPLPQLRGLRLPSGRRRGVLQAGVPHRRRLRGGAHGRTAAASSLRRLPHPGRRRGHVPELRRPPARRNLVRGARRRQQVRARADLEAQRRVRRATLPRRRCRPPGPCARHARMQLRLPAASRRGQRGRSALQAVLRLRRRAGGVAGRRGAVSGRVRAALLCRAHLSLGASRAHTPSSTDTPTS
mmetsp:Transcript_23094/g.77918  ORF Transcript_23094/g.77918 Transcript_23094/m.77918 type:complete len:433 (+) Transcript_23094:648-1946(+)